MDAAYKPLVRVGLLHVAHYTHTHARAQPPLVFCAPLSQPLTDFPLLKCCRTFCGSSVDETAFNERCFSTWPDVYARHDSHQGQKEEETPPEREQKDQWM